MKKKKEIYFVSDIARIFHYDKRSVTDMCQDGRIKAYKLPKGRKWLISASEFERMKEGNLSNRPVQESELEPESLPKIRWFVKQPIGGENLEKRSNGFFMTHLKTGQEVLDFLKFATSNSYSAGDPKSNYEKDLITYFSQNLEDFLDDPYRWGPESLIEFSDKLSQSLAELDKIGFWLFGRQVHEPFLPDSSSTTINNLSVILQMLRKDSDGITQIQSE
jgi:hypothetical protein